MNYFLKVLEIWHLIIINSFGKKVLILLNKRIDSFYMENQI
jgi:hypothetical protein